MARALTLSIAFALAVAFATSMSTTRATSDEALAHVVVQLDGGARRFEERLDNAIPAASVHWRYRLLFSGVSVVLPENDVPRLSGIAGVRRVFDAATYHVTAGPDAQTIRARELPGSALASAGEGIKIGFIDDGVDQRHPFFDPDGYTMPAGFPKGQEQYTTAKVIAARAFPPPGTAWPHAGKPFDPEQSDHATHVAGIAAGNANTLAQGARIGGIAPRAYIGNYKALTVPTDAGVGLDGNAPEIVAAIEAAVADGMDVINLSIGEPEVEPSRDVVALALDAAAARGVVPVVAAGNDFDDFGQGSLLSPGNSAAAITVGAATSAATPAVAGFSSAGPSPLSLRLKPDVVAPGTSILSAEPGGWRVLSGTSMAAPHVAGSVALLLQRHREWSPAQVKAALTTTARPLTAGGSIVAPTRAGAGMIDVAAADTPLLRPNRTSISFGLVREGERRRSVIELADAGGGQGEWTVDVDSITAPKGAALVSQQSLVTVPGSLTIELAGGATDGDVTGSVVLRREGATRRIPVWGRIATPKLAASSKALTRPGVYAGDTRGRSARVRAYRYPEVPTDGQLSARLAGPEQVFRVRITRPVANFGVAIIDRGRGSRVEPRIVANGDENQLTGYAALPINHNPYVDEFAEPVLVSGALRPSAGTYHVVFDSPTRATAGTFRFRFWVDDVTPPTARFVGKTVRSGEPLRVRVTDAGAGIDPRSLEATLDGKDAVARLNGAIVTIPTAGLRQGTHRVRLELSDYQESRNTENVARILPNTRVLTATVRVR